MLALLAFACFPVLAQATVYEPEDVNLPNNGGNNTPTIPHKNTGNDESSPNADASDAADGNGSSQPNDESSGSQNAASGGGNPSSPGGGGDAQGKAGVGASGVADKPGGKLQSLESLQPTSSTADDGSSPLVPILIAVAVLAAISVGAVLARQRRGSGRPVSPKAS